MKKFFKVEAISRYKETTLKRVFNVYSETEVSAKSMVYRHTKIMGYRVKIINIKEIEVIKLLGWCCAKAENKELKDMIGYIASVLSVGGIRDVKDEEIDRSGY